jgi:hypothetical protein
MDTERCIAMFIRDVLFLDQDPQALAAKSAKNVRAPSRSRLFFNVTVAGESAGSACTAKPRRERRSGSPVLS